MSNYDEEQNKQLEDRGNEQPPLFDEKKQRRILRRSKWKARFQTAVSAIFIMIAVLIVTSIFTMIYYGWGTPDRAENYANVINYTSVITDPYSRPSGTSSNVKTLFRMEATRDLVKRVGRATNKVGEMKVNYFFSLMAYPEREYTTESTQTPLFMYPRSDNARDLEHTANRTWDRLMRLPEGTVTSAYVSFGELLDTSEIFEIFAEKDLDLLWFAVDTGVEAEDRRTSGSVLAPIGFPRSPIWHEDDYIVTSSEEQKGFLFGKIVSEGRVSPEYKEGDYEVLHAQFFKTLRFLENYESKADKLYQRGRLELNDRIQYLEANGVKHYGAVITGPTKEVLSLRDEPAIALVEVDEVDFWNW